ncbi:HNH endonuclease [Agrobacterium vaccinii]|uniref:HNH endonuclease signature motif containing protein n=1 Tax=Agrobacterium vaccinii TaxID=2735528 RepID=UPI001E615347|nr:HNH endonuclease signature motif containing protein [Agrobacterium vaccinii]UHS60570.1 HNH endonuclease [Agrobacterium vaccinii]
MANRKEFTKKTQREAFTRSGFKCEAIGAMYGLPSGQRCNADLALGVQFDHIVLDANSKDNSLENCAAVCIKCHKWKTANHDIPMAAKTVRQQDKVRGIKTKPAKPLLGPSFAKSEKSSSRDPNKGLPPLPRNSFYEAKP